MPRIQSRLHVDELQSTRQALAAVERENATLRQQLHDTESALGESEARSSALSTQVKEGDDALSTAHSMLDRVQAHYEARERRLQERVRRLETDVSTLEGLLQPSRQREAAAAAEPAAPIAAGPSAAGKSCATCAQLQESLRRAEAELRRVEEALCTSRENSRSSARDGAGSGPPRPPPSPPSVPMAMTAAPPSAHASYWQDQLLCITQQAAASLEAVQRHTRSIASSPSPSIEGCDTRVGASLLAHAEESAAEQWSGRLQQLQQQFDAVVEADAKLISFLLLVAEQQSAQVQRLQQQWQEAQHTVQEAEAVMDEARARLDAQAAEVSALRAECAALTAAQSRHEAQLSQQVREAQLSSAALHRLQEECERGERRHASELAALTAKLRQAAELQAQTASYAQRLEAALQDKRRLLESETAARTAQQRQEVLAATGARVAQFVSQLSQSAQQLQSSLTQLSSQQAAATASPSSSPPSAAYATPVRLGDGGDMSAFTFPATSTQMKAAASVSSPDPSPPGVSSGIAGVSPSPISVEPTRRSPSSMAYDDSIFLPNTTQPFVS